MGFDMGVNFIPIKYIRIKKKGGLGGSENAAECTNTANEQS